jgi:hypothetical protein
MNIQVPTSPGELIDKITILQIKTERMTDPAKTANVQHELAILDRTLQSELPSSPELAALSDELKQVNLQLWDIEDEIRECERRKDFGDRFIQLARSVYFTNDRRSEVKRKINLLLGSRIIEEKSYSAY